MARTDGLVRLSEKSKEERVAIARKGGLRSVEVRKENLIAKRAATIALKLQPTCIDKKLASIIDQMGAKDDKLTVMTISMTNLAYKAMHGDTNALHMLLETAHMTPKSISEIGKLQLATESLDRNNGDDDTDKEPDPISTDTAAIEDEIRKMGIYGG